MKLFCKNVSGLMAGLRRPLLAAALLGSILTSNAQFNSPEGSWDFVISGGGQQGIAFITFSSDYTFSGHEILVTKANNTSTNVTGRGSVNTERDPASESAGSTNLFGYSPISGQWFYDAKGHTIGNFAIAVAQSSTSNALSGISFTGKVVPGKRFTLLASSPEGKLTYKGVPQQPLSSLSGYWNGYKTQSAQSFIEFFSLSPYGDVVNMYSMDGVGPGYTYASAICMASVQKKIGFAMLQIPDDSTNGLLRASFGSFVNKPGKVRGKTKGIIEPGTGLKFDTELTPPLF
ncbi:MAG: hypothetical protein ACTHLW_15085 [Verrucomicrobiota bacterium]